MRISLRLIVSLVVAVSVVACFFAYVQVGQEKERHSDELDRRSRLLAESLQETIGPLIEKGPSGDLERLLGENGDS